MTGSEAKRQLQNMADELKGIRYELNNLLDQMSNDFQGIGVEQVVSAGRRASNNCSNIAYTLRNLNTSSLDKKKNGSGTGGAVW